MIGALFLWAGGQGGPSAWPILGSWRAKPRRNPSLAAFADLPDVLSTDRLPLTLDFLEALAPGDTLASATATMDSAIDANAALLLWGAPAVAGGVATQWVGPGWLAGAAYSLKMVVVTAAGGTLAGVARLRCLSPD